jgi:hypothetical protein
VDGIGCQKMAADFTVFLAYADKASARVTFVIRGLGDNYSCSTSYSHIVPVETCGSRGLKLNSDLGFDIAYITIYHAVIFTDIR